jgi:hypothetical protein
MSVLGSRARDKENRKGIFDARLEALAVLMGKLRE